MAKKKSENIYMVVGEDTDLIKDEIKKIESLFNKNNDVDIISFFSEETDTSTIIDNCNSFSVFSNMTLIKLYDFHTAKIDLLAKYSENPNTKTILVLISFKNKKDLGTAKAMKTLQSNSKIVDIKPLYENQIIDKVHAKLRELNLKYDRNVVEYIVQQVGSKDSGIDKFFEVVKEAGIKNKMTIEDVKDLETVSTEKNLFAFLDYLFGNNIISAINSYRSLVNEGIPLIVINKNIYNKASQYIKYLALLEQGKKQDEIMKELKVYNSWIFSKISKEAKQNKDINRLEYILTKCYEIDRAIKSETEESVSVRFELFLTELKKDMLIF